MVGTIRNWRGLAHGICTPMKNCPKQESASYVTIDAKILEAASKAGGGMKAQSELVDTTATPVLRNPGFAIYSAQAGYRFNSNWQLNLNIDNLWTVITWVKQQTAGIMVSYAVSC